LKTFYKFCFAFFISVICIADANSQLSGSYTIGSGGNYSTITDAVNALQTSGVNGPVVFNILPGTYGEQIVIDSIPNVSSVNNVTFKSSTDLASSVVWGYFSDVSPTISIHNTEFISFKYLTFETTVYGIYINGYNKYLRGINISNNKFNNVQLPIEIWYADSPLIEKNDIASHGYEFGGVNRVIGISLNGCTNGFKVLKNTFNMLSSIFGSGSTCIVLYASYGNSEAVIANNFFQSSSRNNPYAIDIQQSHSINIYNNTSYLGGSFGRIYSVNSSSSIVFKNNLGLLNGGMIGVGYAYVLDNSDIEADFDTYNYVGYFAKVNGTNISTLLDFKNMTGDDINSNEASIYTSDGYHLTGTSVGDTDLLGIPIAGIFDDIDGDPRDPFKPFKGADEGYLFSIGIYLDAFIEGFYNGQTNLQTGDTIRAYLYNATAPYNKVDSVKGFLNSDGKLTLGFVNAQSGTYYIVVKHRNSIETWSRSGGENLLSNSYSTYDFTTSDTQAFGNNLKQKRTKYCIYSGDVNQSGFIDVHDLIRIYNDAHLNNVGYLPSDLNGDNIVDASDMLICFDNLSVAVSSP